MIFFHLKSPKKLEGWKVPEIGIISGTRVQINQESEPELKL